MADRPTPPSTRTPRAGRSWVRILPQNGVSWPRLQPEAEAQALALQFQLDESQWWPPERLVSRQLRQIQRVIRHAQATVPFYRERLSSVASLPAGQLSLEAFRTIPPMTRRDIQDAGPSLISRRVPAAHGKAVPVRSSGSTGRPIEVQATALMGIFMQALTMRGHRWHKRDLSAKNVDIRTAFASGQAPQRIRWAPLPSTGPSVRLDISRPINTLFDDLIAEGPHYLQTHPYTLQGLVERSREIGVRPKHLREVRTFGEALLPGLRGLVEVEWGVPLTDQYSAMEVGTIAIQCPQATALHVQSECVLVEVLDEDDRPCVPGEPGRVVLTPLHNFASPLIRYEIGDYASVGAPCPCGRGLPVLAEITGRQRNLLVYPNGDRIFPQARPGGLVDVAPIRQFQLVQPSVETLVFRVVPARPWTKAEERALRAFLHKKFGHPFAIEIEYLDDIPRQANGKFDEFISYVAPSP